jgi:hypothetical protein
VVASVRRLVLAAILAAMLAMMMTAGPVQAQGPRLVFVDPSTGDCRLLFLTPGGHITNRVVAPQVCEASA